MKIIVSIKQVPDTSGKVAVNPDGTLNRASMQTITNPDDMNEMCIRDSSSIMPAPFWGGVKLLKMLVGEPFRPMVVASIRGSSFSAS